MAKQKILACTFHTDGLFHLNLPCGHAPVLKEVPNLAEFDCLECDPVELTIMLKRGGRIISQAGGQVFPRDMALDADSAMARLGMPLFHTAWISMQVNLKD